MSLSHTDYGRVFLTWKAGEKGQKESTYDAMGASPGDAWQKSKQNLCFGCPEIYF